MRTEIFSKFVQISQILWQLKNYDGVLAIFFGFQSSAVNRLKLTKLNVKPTIIDIYKNFEIILSENNHYEKLRSFQNLNQDECIPGM